MPRGYVPIATRATYSDLAVGVSEIVCGEAQRLFDGVQGFFLNVPTQIRVFGVWKLQRLWVNDASDQGDWVCFEGPNYHGRVKNFGDQVGSLS